MRATLIILLVIITQTMSQKQPCSNESSVVLINHMYNGITYTAREYFVDNGTGIKRDCLCMKVTCARKCCPLGQVYNVTSKNCQTSSVIFNPPVWADDRQVDGFNASKEFHLIQQRMTCDKSLLERIVYPTVDTYRLQTDGSLYVQSYISKPWIIYGPDKYCIDTFVDDINVKEDRINALICFTEQQEKTYYIMNIICMLISCFFILLTVGVYAGLPKLRNLFGFVLIAYLLSFFVGFLFMASLKILFLVEKITSLSCRIFSFIVYFSVLSAFFWLNVMCYDMWRTFSGKRGQQGASSVHACFLVYSAYALGGPTLLILLLAGLELADLPYHPLLPNFRRNGCFLFGNAKLLYMYGPITILCIINLILFILVTWNIIQIKKQMKQILKSTGRSRNDQHNKDTQRFSFYVKLYAVMGFNWILEVISYLYPAGDEFWQFTDIYNGLIGLIIFIIFVCKKNILRMLKSRYRELRGLPSLENQLSIQTNMSSNSRSSLEMSSKISIETIHKN